MRRASRLATHQTAIAAWSTTTGHKRNSARRRLETGRAEDDGYAKVVDDHPAADATRGAAVHVVTGEPAGDTQGEQGDPSHAAEWQGRPRKIAARSSRRTTKAGTTIKTSPVSASRQAVSLSKRFIAFHKTVFTVCALCPWAAASRARPPHR